MEMMEILEILMKLGASNKISHSNQYGSESEAGGGLALYLKLPEVGLISRKSLSMACDGGYGFVATTVRCRLGLFFFFV